MECEGSCSTLFDNSFYIETDPWSLCLSTDFFVCFEWCNKIKTCVSFSGIPSSDPDHPDYVPTRFGSSTPGHGPAAVRRYNSATKRKALFTPPGRPAQVLRQLRPEQSEHDTTVTSSSEKISTSSTILDDALEGTGPDVHNESGICELPSTPCTPYSPAPSTPSACTPHPPSPSSPQEILQKIAPLPDDHSSCFQEMDSLRRERDDAIRECDLAMARANAACLNTSLVMDDDTKILMIIIFDNDKNKDKWIKNNDNKW